MSSTAVETIELRDIAGVSNQNSISAKTVPLSPHQSDANLINESSDETASHLYDSQIELPPIDGGYRAWTFLLAAFITELLCLGGAFSFSIFQDYLVQSKESPLKNATNVQVSAIGTLLVSFTYFAPPLMRGVWARYAKYNRTMGFLALQVAGLSLIIASFVSSFPSLLIFMGLIPGSMLGLGTVNYLVWLPQWFFEKRGLANGIAFAGAGSGGIVYPFILHLTLQRVGFAWTLRIWALVVMLVGGTISYFIRPRLPPTNSTPSPSSSSRGAKDIWKQWTTTFSFAATPLWLAQATATFVASMSFFSVSFYLAVYCTSLGLSSSSSTGIVAAFNGAALIGEIVVGYACDRYAYPPIIGMIGVIGALSAFLLFGLAQSLVGVVSFVLLYGLAAGSYCSTWSASAFDISRLKSMQTANVLLSFVFIRGVASAVGPLVAASLYNPQKNPLKQVFGAFGFENLIIFVGTCMLGLIFCWPITSNLRQKAVANANERNTREQF